MVYFLSDFHLRINCETSSQREKKIVKFLYSISDSATEIYFMGDLFDFWYEYNLVIPKGFTRLFGAFHYLLEKGIKLYIFTGNHDMWMFGYFEKEFGIPVYHDLLQKEILGKKFLLGHGDGKGPEDKGYKIIRKILRHPLCVWVFGILPADWGLSLAHFWSKKSRDAQIGDVKEKFMGADKEWLIQYCNRRLEKEHIDFFVFAHRHLPIQYDLNKTSQYINCGDWINHNSYALWDGDSMRLLKWE